MFIHIEFALFSFVFLIFYPQKRQKNGGERGIRTPSLEESSFRSYRRFIIFSFPKTKNPKVKTGDNIASFRDFIKGDMYKKWRKRIHVMDDMWKKTRKMIHIVSPGGTE